MSVLVTGDCREVMAAMEPCWFDAVVTDPPYELGFMGKAWDQRGVSFDPATWEAVLRVTKPGGHLLCFGGTRTWHRIAVAIEDAGWEIRETFCWLYGSGFPKSLDVSKALDKAAGAEREVVGPRERVDGKAPGIQGGGQNGILNGFGPLPRTVTSPATPLAVEWSGYGTALKPGWEPIVLARRPLEGTVAGNVAAWGTGGLNIDGCRISHSEECRMLPDQHGSGPGTFYAQGGRHGETLELKPNGRWPANVVLSCDCDGERHDADCPVRMLDEQSGITSDVPRVLRRLQPRRDDGWGMADRQNGSVPGDSGGASRFYYCAKASRSEREAGLEGMPPGCRGNVTGRDDDAPGQNHARSGIRAAGVIRNLHPTVKPLALMRWLCRLVMPPGGWLLLDPFMGSGTTGMAVAMEGGGFVGIEQDAGYIEIARRRIALAATWDRTTADVKVRPTKETGQLSLFGEQEE